MHRVRTTISVDPEIHEIFKRMAEVSGSSVSRCMGDWLASTSEGAELVTHRMEGIKRSPLDALIELRKDFSSIVDKADVALAEIKKKAAPGQQALRSSPAGQVQPASRAPSSNTGLKSPTKGRGKGGNS